MPLALAGTAGIVLDRLVDIAPAQSLLAALAFLLAWLITRLGQSRGLAVLYLCVAVAAAGAAGLR